MPAQRTAAWLAHGRTPVDTAHYVGWPSRELLAQITARPEVAAALAAVESERARPRGDPAARGVARRGRRVLYAVPGTPDQTMVAFDRGSRGAEISAWTEPVAGCA